MGKVVLSKTYNFYINVHMRLNIREWIKKFNIYMEITT